MGFYTVQDNVDDQFASDINQFANALSGQQDVGNITAFSPISAPSTPLTAVVSTTLGNLVGNYEYVVAFLTGNWHGEQGTGTLIVQGTTGYGVASSSVSPNGYEVNLSNIPTGPTGTVARVVGRTKSSVSGVYYTLAQINDNTTTSWVDNVLDSSLGAQLGTTNTTGSKFVGDGSSLTGVVRSSEVGQPNGIASLDINGQVPYSQLTNVSATSQAATDSGVIMYPPITAGLVPFLRGTTNQNNFKFGSDNAFVRGAIQALINNGGMSDGSNLIQLDAPPTADVTPSLPGSARDDLVFLETWRDVTTGAWNWRIRVVDGVDFATYPDGLGATNVYAQGGATTVTTMIFVKASSVTGQTFSGDNGLYVAETGSSNTADGYVYAIPLFRVRRRNSSAYDPDTNVNGGAQLANYINIGGASVGASSIKISVTGTAPPWTANVTKISVSGSINVDTFTVTTITNNNDGSYTIGLSGTINQSVPSGYNVLTYSDRPDGLFSNIIDESDIIDLRHQVSLTGFNMESLLEKNLALLLRGQLTTNKTLQYARDYIGLDLANYTDDVNTLLFCNFDEASINGTANGVVVTGTALGGYTPSFKNGVQGLALEMPSAAIGAGVSYPITPSEALGSVEMVVSNNNSGIYEHLVDFIGTSINIQVLNNGNEIALYDSSTGEFSGTFVLPNDGSKHFLKFTWNQSGNNDSFELDGIAVSSFPHVAWGATCTAVTLLGSTNNTSFVGNIDLVRVSNIVRTTSPLPAEFNYANGDRILDGPDADFSFWSDDVGGTAGVNGRTNPLGLTDVPNQMAASVSYNGSEVRHYYGYGFTPGTSELGTVGSNPTGSFDNSAEYYADGLESNETPDGTRTTFTFTLPSYFLALGITVLYQDYSHTVQMTGWQIPASMTLSGNTLTVVFATAPATGTTVFAFLGDAARHAHFIPSTKGFILHDWTDDTFVGNGTTTTFQTTKYDVTSVNHIRVNGAIQNGGYTVSGTNAATTLSASVAVNATTISVASASNFVVGQNIRISEGNGTWYTTTVTTISGTTITIPATTVALNANATVQGVSMITFTTAPASGATVDIVYESVLTPSEGDYIRIAYQRTPYQGVASTTNSTGIMLYAHPFGFVNTFGTGKENSSGAGGNYQIPLSAQLPSLNGEDYLMKSDVISITGVSLIKQNQLVKKLLMQDDAYTNGSTLYSNMGLEDLIGQSIQLGASPVTRGLTAGTPVEMTAPALNSAIPHQIGLCGLVQFDGETMLFIVVSYSNDTNNHLYMSGSACDVFRLQGRPLIKGYAGVTN